MFCRSVCSKWHKHNLGTSRIYHRNSRQIPYLHTHLIPLVCQQCYCLRTSSKIVHLTDRRFKILSRIEGGGGLCDLQYGFWIGWLDLLTPYTHITLGYRQNNAIADLHIFQFTVTHALGFSVFTSRIRATDYSSLTVTSNHTRILLLTA
jgi:hypothetical protein